MGSHYYIQEVISLELSGSYFDYSGISSRNYGLIFAHANTDEMTALAGEIQSNTIFDKRGKRNYLVGENYENSPVRFEAEVITDDDSLISGRVRREIEKWLFHQTDYQKLYVDINCDEYAYDYALLDGVPKRLYYNCRFMNPEKILGNGGIVGYKFTIECDSCMAWMDEMTYTFSLNHSSESSNSVIEVEVDSDLNDYIYPKVTIEMGSIGGNIMILNTTDSSSRLTAFTGLTPMITLTMNGGSVNYISGDNYLKFYGRNFVRLLDGKNKLTVTGNVKKISFTFNNRRFM